MIDIPGVIANNENAKEACDFYHKFRSDIARLAFYNVKHFRISLSWPRLLPNGKSTEPNPIGVRFYNDMIDAMLHHGITPYITLHHWDLPTALVDKNSSEPAWLGKEIIDQFNDYADFCFKTFGDRIKYWITFNEPFCMSWLAYGVGKFAPRRCSAWRDGYPKGQSCKDIGGGGDTAKEPYIVGKTILLAHAKAYRTYHAKYAATQKGKIGITLNCDFGLPYDKDKPEDVEAAETHVHFMLGWFANPIENGDWPEVMIRQAGERLPPFTPEEKAQIKGTSDFFGINHYSTSYFRPIGVGGGDWESDRRVASSFADKSGVMIGPIAESFWLAVYGPGLRGLLNFIKKNYGDEKGIYIFENGVSVPNENNLKLADALKDTFRINYFRQYLKGVKQAIHEDKINIKGYFAWSYLDNFEWNEGYSVRFGMTYVDYRTKKRYPKDSLLWYSQLIKTKMIS